MCLCRFLLIAGIVCRNGCQIAVLNIFSALDLPFTIFGSGYPLAGIGGISLATVYTVNSQVVIVTMTERPFKEVL